MMKSLYAIFVCVYSLTLLSQVVLAGAPAEPSCVAAVPVGGGGRQCGVDASVDSVIREFLASQDEGLTDVGKFHVHGWRWHTLSLVRETKRLQKLAERFQIRFNEDASTRGSTTASKDAPHPLKQAADYVVGFNLKGLHRIEADCFFPWMREKITSLTDGSDVSDAFATVMDQLEDDRQSVARLGKSITQMATVAGDESKPKAARLEAVRSMVQDAAALIGYAESMMELENELLVPAIAALVPESEQEQFNGKVLSRLGLLDSRIHLVHMKEAVWEAGDTTEQLMFEKEIPSIPQMMIPRWKRNLYDPLTRVLDL